MAQGALGRASVDVRAFVEGALRGDHARGRGVCAPAMTDTLNDYIEAQVHGALSLSGDVDAIVIDPAFMGTPSGDRLLATAERSGVDVQWHAGLEPVSEVPHAGYRPAVFLKRILRTGVRRGPRRSARRGGRRADALATVLCRWPRTPPGRARHPRARHGGTA
jgi:hypothetical protein